ncbi:MAG: UDP binding domain-containing protein [Hymenobacter sp.]
MGATFKENVEDIRNSKVADVIQELKNFSVNVDIVDPHANSNELNHEYGFRLTPADEIRDRLRCRYRGRKPPALRWIRTKLTSSLSPPMMPYW